MDEPPPPETQPGSALPPTEPGTPLAPYFVPPAPTERPVAPEPPSESLSNALQTGRGFANPRRAGLQCLALGALTMIVNAIVVAAAHRYLVWLAVLPGPLAGAAATLLATNEPRARRGGAPAPLWSWALLAVALAGGLVAAFFVHRMLVRHHR